MRFGRRSHDIEPQKIDAAVRSERQRLVGILRALADRLEKAPEPKFTEGTPWISAALEPLVRAVDRALGR
jgi:hypothetical protein